MFGFPPVHAVCTPSLVSSGAWWMPPILGRLTVSRLGGGLTPGLPGDGAGDGDGVGLGEGGVGLTVMVRLEFGAGSSASQAPCQRLGFAEELVKRWFVA